MDREKLDSLVSEAGGSCQVLVPSLREQWTFESTEDLEAFVDRVREYERSKWEHLATKSETGTLDQMVSSIRMAIQRERMACIRACEMVDADGVELCISAIRARGWE